MQVKSGFTCVIHFVSQTPYQVGEFCFPELFSVLPSFNQAGKVRVSLCYTFPSPHPKASKVKVSVCKFFLQIFRSFKKISISASCILKLYN